MEIDNEKLKLSILMPVFNEGINLKTMLHILRATIDIPHEVLVVYDTIDDDSIPAVAAVQRHYPGLRAIHNQRGRGVANAIRSGVAAARADIILVIAADDIGPVLAVDEMIALMDQGCDLVSATRYAHGGRVFGGSPISRLFSRTANKLFYWLSGFSLTDATVGIKMFRRDIFHKLNLESRPIGWLIAFEIAIKAQLLHLNIGEVPIVSINRFYGGKSSFKPGPWIMEYSKWFVKGLIQIYASGAWRSRASLNIPKRLSEARKR